MPIKLPRALVSLNEGNIEKLNYKVQVIFWLNLLLIHMGWMKTPLKVKNRDHLLNLDCFDHNLPRILVAFLILLLSVDQVKLESYYHLIILLLLLSIIKLYLIILLSYYPSSWR